MIYPWHNDTWKKICQAVIHPPHPPHALLLHGAHGIGKTQFAFAVGYALLCEARQVDGKACGICQACHWSIQGNHPDLIITRPSALDKDTAEENDNQEEKIDKKNSQEILLKQIKTLITAINIASHRGKYKVAILYPVEKLNVYAANALLKTLEEPPPHTIFILVSHQLDLVLPTILSRCQRIILPTPKRDAALAWLISQNIANADEQLQYMSGSPLAALASVQEPATFANNQTLLNELSKGDGINWLTLAEQLHKENLSQILFNLQRWSYDLLSMRLTQNIRYFPTYTKILNTLAQQIEPLKISKFLITLQNHQRYANHPLNIKLVLESCLIHYSQLFKKNASLYRAK